MRWSQPESCTQSGTHYGRGSAEARRGRAARTGRPGIPGPACGDRAAPAQRSTDERDHGARPPPPQRGVRSRSQRRHSVGAEEDLAKAPEQPPAGLRRRHCIPEATAARLLPGGTLRVLQLRLLRPWSGHRAGVREVLRGPRSPGGPDSCPSRADATRRSVPCRKARERGQVLRLPRVQSKQVARSESTKAGALAL